MVSNIPAYQLHVALYIERNAADMLEFFFFFNLSIVVLIYTASRYFSVRFLYTHVNSNSINYRPSFCQHSKEVQY